MVDLGVKQKIGALGAAFLLSAAPQVTKAGTVIETVAPVNATTVSSIFYTPDLFVFSEDALEEDPGSTAVATTAAYDSVAVEAQNLKPFGLVSLTLSSPNGAQYVDLVAYRPGAGIEDFGDVLINATPTAIAIGQNLYDAEAFPLTASPIEFDSATVNSAVPEPAAWALLLIGFAGLGSALRRRRGELALI